MYVVGNATDDPEYRAIHAAVRSEAGRKAAEAAAAKAEPALSGVDEMLTAIFVRYRQREPYALANAGYCVAQLMRELGYVKARESVKSPAGCTASHGALWLLPEISD